MLSQHLSLTTPAIMLATGKTIAVYANHTFNEKKDACDVYLMSDDPTLCKSIQGLLRDPPDKITLGKMKLSIINKDNKKIVFIENMENYRRHLCKHVGTALHEFAFRFSIACGAMGNIELDAVRNTHYIHYLNGFRLRYDSINIIDEYYFRLADALIHATHRISKDLGSKKFHLPQSVINAKLVQFKLNVVLPQPATLPTEPDFKSIDKLLGEAARKSIATKLIVGLYKGLHSIVLKDRLDYDSLPDENPAEECETTRLILAKACANLCKLLPLDNNHKQTQFDILLTGAIIFSMLQQDHKFGTQERFNHRLLFPGIKLDDLMAKLPNRNILQACVFLGTSVLVEKSITLDITCIAKVFSELGGIPDFQLLFDKYDLHQRTESAPTYGQI